MNRILSYAAVAASLLFLCAFLSACGGGGGSSAQVAQTTPSSSGAASSPGGTESGTGDGGGNGGAGDGNTYPIPNCTPKQVIVALLGDSTMTEEFYTGELQKDLDAHFGSGSVVVQNYALRGETSDSYLYVTGDVIVENYGIGDMMAGVNPSDYATHIVNMRTTLVVTQNPIVSQIYDPAPYLNAAEGLGLPVADVYSYVEGLIQPASEDGTVPAVLLGKLEPDGIHPIPEVYVEIVDNVVAPAVFTQVAPLRCQLS